MNADQEADAIADLAASRRRRDQRAEVERSVPERLPAHSIEAEQGVLGCIFLSPNECLGECIEKFKSGPEVFYDLKHRTIYEMLVEMWEAKAAIDLITVRQRLKDKQKLEDVGGLAYLANLPDLVPSAANVSYYISFVLEKYLLRRILQHCVLYADKVYEHDGGTDALIEDFESSALAVAESVIEVRDTSIRQIVKRRIDFYEECEKRGGGISGISTGFQDLDQMIDGMKPAEMIVIAARPSAGKTAIAMNIAERVAVDQRIPVGVFSLEMSAESLVGRMISSRGRVNERDILRARCGEGDQKRIFIAGVTIGKSPLHIDDTGGLTITQLRAKARRLHQQHGCRLFVIDYMQMLRAAHRRQNRQEEMADISTGVKAMAKELNCPVIAICQLNRELEKEKDRKPRISDLRESGQIEQDADVIGMLYAANAEAAASNSLTMPVNLLIAKQRNGPTGDVQLMFFKEFTRFESISKVGQ